MAAFLIGNAHAQNWELVWSDEFEGEELDESKWSYQYGTGASEGLVGWGNNESQYYTDREENIFVRDGNLHIVAREESYGGQNYTSARIRSINNGDWRYGRFEIRAKMPIGQGLWPAIWMMPTDDVYGGWAASGEIDIMEYLGHEPDIVHGTLHYGGGWPDNVHTGDYYQLDEGRFSDDFYTFALEWEHGEMRWYVDGELYQTQNNWYTQGHDFPAPFDQRFHMILNVAVGGNWPGYPDHTTEFPQEMIVDYVRVYQDTDAEARVALPMTFEDEFFNWEEAFTNFDGGSVSVVENPAPDQVNSSDRVGKMVKDGGEFWGGAWFKVDRPFSFDSDNNGISMKVWSPREDVPVAVKVEQSDGDEEHEVVVSTSAGGEWEVMEWDMSGAGFNETWDMITLIFDLEEGQTGDGSDTFTWYFDDLEITQAREDDPLPDGPDSPSDLHPVTLPLDFEDRDFNWDMAFFGFDGGNAGVVENPHPDNVNDSDWVGMMVKDGGAFWAGAFMHIDQAFSFDSDNHTVTMKVWSPREDVPVLFKVEQQNGDEEYEVAVSTTTSEEWEELTWDMSGADATIEWDLITLIFDLQDGQIGDGSADFTWYFDDLHVSGVEVPTSVGDPLTQTPDQLTLAQNYPNPFNPATTISFSLPESAHASLAVYNLLGQRVALLKDEHLASGQYSVTFDASGLSSGTYIYRLQAGDMQLTRSLTLVK
ncbi:family 16 glycosylhydrolase [Balneolales bacterium ANBcel1]|nr:family 16 glycosylhydrolase [Balneolales bacterium ANBcel1]